MKHITILTCVAQIAVFVCGIDQASAKIPAGVNLAQLNGWDIVVTEDAIPSEIFAAEEFQELFLRASGVKLPIVRQVDRADRHIFIGAGEAMGSSNVGFGIEDLGDEDSRILIRDGNIAIAGGRPRGTLYAVYTFLEDYLGVRFLTIDHTHVPPVGDWRVVGPVDRYYRPPIIFRWSAYAEMDNSVFVKTEGRTDAPRFAARLRCNAVTQQDKLGGTADSVLFNHSLYRYVPTKMYGAQHPEYFALVDGRRLVQVTSDAQETEICFTNPDVLQIVTDAVLDELAANPRRRSIAVSQSDSGLYCHCAECSAINDREESGMGALLTFVNSVADEVAREHPHVKVGALAYYYSQKPPQNIKPRPNVVIQLTSHDCSVTDPIRDSDYEETVKFRRDLEGWGKICDHVHLWYYNTNFSTYLLATPNMRVLEPNIRFFVANNIQGIFMQGAFNALGGQFSELRNYVTSRLLWDPNQSGQQLIGEFLNLHYGQAAPPIRRYINMLHDSAEAKGIQEAWWGRAEDYGIDEPVIRGGLDAFAEAMQLAENETVRVRVEKISICAYMAALEEALTWVWYTPTTYPNTGLGRPIDPEVARRTRPYFRTFFQLCKKHDVTMWNEAETNDHMSDYFKSGFGLAPDEAW